MCIETGRKRVHAHKKSFVRGSAGFCNTEKQTPSPQPSPCPFSFPAETVSFVPRIAGHTIDAEIRACLQRTQSYLSFLLSLIIHENVALQPLSTARGSAFLISAFLCHLTLFLPIHFKQNGVYNRQ